MQNLHSGQKEIFSLSPEGNICLKPRMQNLQSGLDELFTLRPACNNCTKGIRSANDALQKGAKNARHVSAKFARDSY